MPSPLDQPAWLTPAWTELGQHEMPGSEANPHIRDFFADAGHPEIVSDEVAWCAAFVSACLERSGVRSTRSLLARDYLMWGDELAAPRLGAIAVLSRDPDPASGHVGFLAGETADALILLGGNQHNAVTVAAFPKSRLLSLRWCEILSPSSAAAPAALANSPQFDHALAHVLEMEGGYTNDPADPGGPTNFGITLADFARQQNQPIDATARDALIHGLQHIPLTVVRAIYLDRYWEPSGCSKLSPPLAFFHFDTAVNMGTGTAIRMLQTALGCTIDGEIGPQTVVAAAEVDVSSCLTAYADLRRRRYRSLSTFPRFGRGWLARVDTTLTRARALTSAPTSGPIPMPIDQSVAPVSAEPKWWGQSMTIWGGIVTGLAAVLPAVGPAFGINVSPAIVHTAADQTMAIIQAVAGLLGTLTVVYGRAHATQPLMQRSLTLKV